MGSGCGWDGVLYYCYIIFDDNEPIPTVGARKILTVKHYVCLTSGGYMLAGVHNLKRRELQLPAFFSLPIFTEAPFVVLSRYQGETPDQNRVDRLGTHRWEDALFVHWEPRRRYHTFPAAISRTSDSTPNVFAEGSRKVSISKQSLALP